MNVTILKSYPITIGGVTYTNIRVQYKTFTADITVPENPTDPEIEAAILNYYQAYTSSGDGDLAGRTFDFVDGTEYVTGEDIFNFFTNEEWLAFITIKNGSAMAAAAVAERFYGQMLGYWNKTIRKDNPQLVTYFNQMVSANVITEARKEEFLG